MIVALFFSRNATSTAHLSKKFPGFGSPLANLIRFPHVTYRCRRCPCNSVKTRPRNNRNGETNDERPQKSACQRVWRARKTRLSYAR